MLTTLHGAERSSKKCGRCRCIACGLLKIFVIALFGPAACNGQDATNDQQPPQLEEKENIVERSVSMSPFQGLLWKNRQRYMYQIKLETEITIGSGKPFKISLQSQVTVTPLLGSGAYDELIFNLSNVDFGIGNIFDDPELKTIEKELSYTYVASYDRGIRVGEERFGMGVSPLAGQLLRSIGSAFQVSSAKEEDWISQEIDGFGEYEAKYQKDSKGEIQKRKIRYLSTLESRGPGWGANRKGQLKVLKSEETVTKYERVIDTVELDEVIRRKGQTSEDIKTKIEIRRNRGIPVVKEARSRDALVAGTVAHSTRRAYGDVLNSRLFDLARIAGRTFEQLIQELEQLPERKRADSREKKSPNQGFELRIPDDKLSKRRETVFALAALFRLEPETLKLVHDVIVSKSKASKTIMDAMGEAGTVAAQAALENIIRSPNVSKKHRIDGATSLIRVAESTPNTLEFIKGLMRDPMLREQVVFGIGTAARDLKERGLDEQSDAFAKILVNALKNAEGPVDKVRCLRGIANAGYSGALNAIDALLRSGNHEVRAAAVNALHRIDDPLVNEMVVRGLADKDHRVRIAAIRVAGRRKVDDALEKAVLNVALSDQSDAVRLHAVQLIGRWLEKRPHLRTPIATAFKTESESRLKDAFEELLEKY